MSTLRRIWRGCRYVEGYGHHPGTVVLLALAVMGWVAAESWVGAAVMLAAFGPVYLYGAYERGRDA